MGGCLQIVGYGFLAMLGLGVLMAMCGSPDMPATPKAKLSASDESQRASESGHAAYCAQVVETELLWCCSSMTGEQCTKQTRMAGVLLERVMQCAGQRASNYGC